MIGYILSFCDTATLPALSLMSFASWEMAGPILYEHAAVRSFDDLKSLFLLVRLYAAVTVTHTYPLGLILLPLVATVL